MKARAVLLMILITFVSFTGFAVSHSDPGQNSIVKAQSLTDGYTLTVIDQVNVDVLFISTEAPDLSTGAYQGVFIMVNRNVPPDSLCYKIDTGQLHYYRTDTLPDKGMLIDRYRYKQTEVIRIRKLPGKHTAKPRDKILKKK